MLLNHVKTAPFTLAFSITLRFVLSSSRLLTLSNSDLAGAYETAGLIILSGVASGHAGHVEHD